MEFLPIKNLPSPRARVLLFSLYLPPPGTSGDETPPGNANSGVRETLLGGSLRTGGVCVPRFIENSDLFPRDWRGGGLVLPFFFFLLVDLQLFSIDFFLIVPNNFLKVDTLKKL